MTIGNPPQFAPGALLGAQQPTGVWIVANPDWIDGPGLVVPYADEISALRAANDAGWQQRAWYVPFGVDLRDVMSGEWKPQSPAEPKRLPPNMSDILITHMPIWEAHRCACGFPIGNDEFRAPATWVEHAASQITAAIERENRNA